MSTWLVPRNRWLCGQRTSCCAKVKKWIQWFYAGRRSRDRKTEETEEYLGTMDCHTESVKNERLAMTNYVNCILSYIMMFNLETIKLIKDEMMSYLLEYLV